MDVATCEAWIDDLFLEMTNEGILNHQFHVSLRIRRAGDHQYVVKVINGYCNLIERNLTELSNYLKEPNIDYARATVCAGRFRIQTCRCVSSLHSLYCEYFRLRTKFMEILQMEMRIFCLRQRS